MLGTHTNMSKINELAMERITSLLRISFDRMSIDEHQFLMDISEILYLFPEQELQSDRVDMVKTIYIKYSN